MQLNHLHLAVADVEACRLFFEKYFDFQCIDTRGAHKLAVLKGKDDFTLVWMSDSLNRNGPVFYPDARQVNELFERLRADQVPMTQQPGTMRGGYGFYFHAPDNILTEVSSPLATGG